MQISIREPDDWHLHLRDAAMLKAVVGSTAAHFARALIMPNLVPPVVTSADAASYQARIQTAIDALPEKHVFKPLMTLYLTEETVASDVVNAYKRGDIIAVKLYPAGATTNSASGVSDLNKVMPVLEAMADNGVTLCIHGEVTDHDVDIFDREACFIENILDPLRQKIPNLRVVMEHVTTRDGVEYVKSSQQNLAATITTHHLMINRNHLLVGGVKPHYYCLPIAKREAHRLALVEAACSGNERFFLGTDSAPHTKSTKESACGCAGVFNALNTMPCVATVFEENQALDRLEAFTSINGANWYGLPPNENTITLVKFDKPMVVPGPMAVEDDWIVPFDPGRDIYWQVVKHV